MGEPEPLEDHHGRAPLRAAEAADKKISETFVCARKVVPRISWLLFKAFWWRMGQKYVIRDFHPLVLFYLLGIVLSTAGFALGLVEVGLRLAGNPVPVATIVLVALLVAPGLQLLLFAMWFDMESNKDLR